MIPSESSGLGLGDHVERALASLGITSERVTRFLGEPCGCHERREKLNQLGAWARMTLSGKVSSVREYLEELIGGKL